MTVRLGCSQDLVSSRLWYSLPQCVWMACFGQPFPNVSGSVQRQGERLSGSAHTAIAAVPVVTGMSGLLAAGHPL